MSVSKKEVLDLVQELRKRGLSNGSSLGQHSGLYEKAADMIEQLFSERAVLVKENIFHGSLEEVKQRVQSEVIGKEGFETGELADIQAPDLTLSDAFQLYAQLRGQTDGAKTVFLMGKDEMWDLSKAEDTRLTEYELRQTVEPYLTGTTLERFIEQEVPFRLENVLGVQVSAQVCHEITEAVKEQTDVMFDYDRFDAFLAEKCEELAPQATQEATLPKKFIFDEELMTNADLQSLNGYLWAVDALVDKLPMPEDMENINFYAEYDVKLDVLSLTATYDTPTADGELHKAYDVPLSDQEKKELLEAMEAYCQKEYGQSLLEFVNDDRAEYDLPAITPPTEKEGRKPPLLDRIQAAEVRTAPTNTSHDRISGSHSR